MEIQLFNFWYFVWLALCIGAFFGLYFLLKNKTEQTKKWTLFSILVFALVLHFLKCFIPPYSTDQSRLYRDIWFVNICGANIFLFPFIFLSKNKAAKDYMVIFGIISGIVSVLYPLEPIKKVDQAAEWLDIVRFYIHHSILWIVPLLTVIFKLHEISYKRVWQVPGSLLLVMLFIMLNQIFQSELGFVPLRGDDFFAIGYKNTSYIWGPDDAIGNIIALFCPKIFKTVPAGEFAGQTKYWPWFWMIVPAYIIITPLAFIVTLVFDHKSFKADVQAFKEKCKTRRSVDKSKGE
ncbi:MAG: YwaF family protein [Clostridia bacterium]|nr:YwaF family protein [Clostridia bacterium]